MISIVVPCYNVEDYILECVESIRQVGLEALEIILVDNNSSDGTAHHLEELESADDIRCFAEKKPGAPAARNLGLSEARGEFIQFLDADDLLVPGKFALQLEQTSDIMIAGYKRRSTEGAETVVHPTQDVWKGLFSTELGITSSNLFRTESVRMVGGWDESLKSSQEYDLMFRMLASGCSYTLRSEELAIVRERVSGQISQGDDKGRWTRYLDLRERILQHLKQEEAEYFKQESAYFYQALFDQIRILSNADPKLGIEKFKQWIPLDFKPQSSPASGKSFLMMMRLFGFAGATRLKRLLK